MNTKTTKKAAPAAPSSARDAVREVVEASLREHDTDPDTVWDDEVGAWGIGGKHGPVWVRPIRLEPEEGDKEGVPQDFLEVFTRVMPLPSYPIVAVYRTLLELNMKLIGCAFGIEGGDIFVRHERTVIDLDGSEFDAIVASVMRNAELIIPILSEEFPVGAMSLM